MRNQVHRPNKSSHTSSAWALWLGLVDGEDCCSDDVLTEDHVGVATGHHPECRVEDDFGECVEVPKQRGHSQGFADLLFVVSQFDLLVLMQIFESCVALPQSTQCLQRYDADCSTSVVNSIESFGLDLRVTRAVLDVSETVLR